MRNRFESKMEEFCGRRRSLWDEMSAAPSQGDSLAGLTLDAVLNNRKQGESRTLLDIIKEDPSSRPISQNNKDRKSWKLFRDKLRLKRAGSAWTSSVHIPASDIPINNHRRAAIMSDDDINSSSPPRSVPENRPPMFLRRGSTRFTPSSGSTEEGADISRPADFLPTRSFKPHGSPRFSNRDGEELNPDPFEVAREGTRRLAAALNDERGMSAREAIAAQEAAAAQLAEEESEESPTAKQDDEEEHHEVEEGEGGGGEAAAETSEGGQPVRMSLMDLLEETDREMGVEGSKYIMGEDEDEEEFEEEEEEEDTASGTEYTCCVCMVRHKGAAFIPCGHTFCRLCSKELYVQRGHCPLCNNFIVEILDIF